MCHGCCLQHLTLQVCIAPELTFVPGTNGDWYQAPLSRSPPVDGGSVGEDRDETRQIFTRLG